MLSMEESTAERLVLIIENNLNHAQLIESIIKNHSIHYQTAIVKDGVTAMSFLHQQGEYANAPRPHLILLDLNLPAKDGREILAEIKSDGALKRIPIVILTASSDEEDVFNSYQLQGNSYVIKAQNLEQLATIVKRIEEFWLEIVTLPPE